MKEKDMFIHGVPACPPKGEDKKNKAGLHAIPSCAAWVETKEAEKAEATAKKDADIHGVPACPGNLGKEDDNAKPHGMPSCAAWVETQAAEGENGEGEMKLEDPDIHGVASCPILRFNRKIKKPRRKIKD